MVFACILLVFFSIIEKTEGGNNSSQGVLTLGILIPWESGWTVGPYIGGAVVVALEEINNRQLLSEYNIEWFWEETKCEARHGLGAALKLLNSHPLSAYIGGGCSVVCEHVALLSDAVNLPEVAFSCTSDRLSDEFTYPTFTRSVSTWVSLAPMYSLLCDTFGWQHIGMVS